MLTQHVKLVSVFVKCEHKVHLRNDDKLYAPIYSTDKYRKWETFQLHATTLAGVFRTGNEGKLRASM